MIAKVRHLIRVIDEELFEEHRLTEACDLLSISVSE
jgi:hypothetical protein